MVGKATVAARKGEKVALAGVAPGPSEAKPKFDRNEAHRKYMREYMRKRRRKEGEK
jgi:hypothetical protein